MLRQLFESRVVVVEPKSDLLEIIAAAHSSSRLACRLDCGQEQTDQDTYDRNDDEQFHQSETTILRTFHDYPRKQEITEKGTLTAKMGIRAVDFRTCTATNSNELDLNMTARSLAEQRQGFSLLSRHAVLRLQDEGIERSCAVAETINFHSGLNEQRKQEVVTRLIFALPTEIVMAAVLKSHVFAAGQNERVVMGNVRVTRAAAVKHNGIAEQ
jgi:hypothetical protein